MFLNGYPYTDFHELNLDFLLKSMEELKKAFASFTASNSLIFAEPMLHDLTSTYAKNTIVLDSDGNAYISLQNVPAGVQLSNADYWLMVFNFEEYTEKANKNFTVNYLRDTTRAPQAYAVGDWLVLDDVLYKVTVAIAADDLLEVGVNLIHFTIEQFLKDFVTSINQIVLQYKNDIDASELAYRQQLALDIANTTASLQAQLDQAIAGATVDSEVINARVGIDNYTYPTLGDALRTQVQRLNNAIADFDVVIGRNKFDKTGGFTPIIYDYYRPYTTGNWVSASGYNTARIPCKPSQDYVVYNGNLHITFYSDDFAETYISGVLSTASGYTFTTPATAKCMCVSLTTGQMNSCQIEEGTTQAGYEAFKVYINSDRMIGEPEDWAELGEALKYKLTGDIGTNIIDSSGVYTPVVNGYYRPYTSGNWVANASYAVVTTPIKANTTYVTHNGNIHACFFSDDAATQYISGVLLNSGGDTFTTPATAVTASFSPSLTQLPTFMIEEGSVRTPYEPFIFGINASRVIGDNNVIYVGATRKYTSISDAVTAAPDGSYIFIDPGTYNESIDVNSTGKFLHLIGSGRDVTIVYHEGSDYNYAPIEIGKGYVEGITFTTDGSDPANSAYAAHIDWATSIDSALRFVGCRFVNDNRAAIGVGLRHNFTLNFTDCEFESNNRCAFIHESPSASNITGQQIEFVNCSLHAAGTVEAIALMEDANESGNECTVLFQRNIVKTASAPAIKGYEYPGWLTPTGSNYLNLREWYIDGLSDLNNDNLMDA